MIEVKEITLSALYSLDYIAGFVKFVDTSESFNDYRIDLYRSTNQNSGFNLLFSNMKRFDFRDFGIESKSIKVEYYYKMRVTNLATNEFKDSEVFSIESREPDNYAYYMTEVYNTYLECVTGNEKVLLLNKIHSGQRCSFCYDPIRSRSQKSNCIKCFGTGYTDGYYKEQPIQVNYLNTSSLSEDFNDNDVAIQKSPITLWTGNWPKIQPEDIIVNHLNQRFVVVGVQPSMKTHYLIRQTIQVTPINKSDAKYDIPVDMKLFL